MRQPLSCNATLVRSEHGNKWRAKKGTVSRQPACCGAQGDDVVVQRLMYLAAPALYRALQRPGLVDAAQRMKPHAVGVLATVVLMVSPSGEQAAATEQLFVIAHQAAE